MSATPPVKTADPVERHVAALSAALHGPAAAKARLTGELRDGLIDATADHVARGLPYEEAARRAVREFGTVATLAPGFQHELTVAQARHTARAVALTAPFLIACWLLLGTAGLDLRAPSGAGFAAGLRLPAVAQVVLLGLSGIAGVAALLAAGTLGCTGRLARWLPTPRHLPLAAAWAGTAAGIAMAMAGLALAVTAFAVAHWPLLLCAAALAGGSHALVATSARVCRRCARLPFAPAS